MKSNAKWGWLLFYVLMLVLFAQSAYEFGQSPHTASRMIAMVMSIVGLIFVVCKAWGQLRELKPQ